MFCFDFLDLLHDLLDLLHVGARNFVASSGCEEDFAIGGDSGSNFSEIFRRSANFAAGCFGAEIRQSRLVLNPAVTFVR